MHSFGPLYDVRRYRLNHPLRPQHKVEPKRKLAYQHILGITGAQTHSLPGYRWHQARQLRTVYGRLRRSSAKRAARETVPTSLLLSWLRSSLATPPQPSRREAKSQSARMFKKRTLKGQKKSAGPTVDAPAEDTAAALDDARFAQEARKRARGLSAQALAAPKPTKPEAPAPAADADALGGLGRDFGASHTGASAAAAVHEKALEEYLANQEAPAEPAPAPAASRDDALYAAVHKFSTTAHHELHAIDATPVRWRGGPLAVRLSPLDSVSTAAHPTHWLIYAQVCSPQARGGCPGRVQGRHPRHPWLRRDGHGRGRGGDG